MPVRPDPVPDALPGTHPGAHPGALLDAVPARQPVRWGDLRKRALSAALLGPTSLLCIWLGADAWTALVGLAATGLACEWVTMCGWSPLRPPGAAVPLVVLLAAAFALVNQEALALAALAAGVVALWAASPGRPSLAGGVVYVGLASVALMWLRGDGAVGRANVLFIVLVVWASDVGAYAAGRWFGGPRLAPRISPGKTWAGAVGGLVLAAVVGEWAAHVLGAGSPGRAALVAAALGVATQAGDLLESAIKRRFGVKDSGWLIPGHGGLLDRLDGLLTAAPTAAALALVLGRGVHLWG